MDAPLPASPAAVDATAHVLVERLDDTVVLTGDTGHHLQRVRRIRRDEVVTAADGTGRWRVYDVTAAHDGRVELRATSVIGHEPRLVPELAVACALTKGDRPELVVQKLTELGVDRVVFLAAERSVVHWTAGRADAALARLARVAREAAAQSRRCRWPLVEGPVSPAAVADEPGLVVASVTGITAGDLDAPPPRPGSAPEWVVAVGPEGGFTPEELSGFGSAPRLAVGPYVLRAETAAIAVAAALAGQRTPSAR